MTGMSKSIGLEVQVLQTEWFVNLPCWPLFWATFKYSLPTSVFGKGHFLYQILSPFQYSTSNWFPLYLKTYLESLNSSSFSKFPVEVFWVACEYLVEKPLEFWVYTLRHFSFFTSSKINISRRFNLRKVKFFNSPCSFFFPQKFYQVWLSYFVFCFVFSGL